MRLQTLLIKGLRALALTAAFTGGSAFAETTGYYQMPVMNDTHLVFASEGDLWRASASGGTAIRLTTHPEAETNPSLSPDGKWIAFQASYDGPGEIYIMPVAGGTPKRLTFEGGRVTARGWMGNGKVLYRSSNVSGTIPRLLRTVDVESLETQDIPLDGADEAAMLADGQTLIFTRYGLSMFSDNAIQYRGGRMAQLWRYRLGSKREAVRLAADFAAPIRHPMVWNERIYFISDKSGTDNIWSMDTTGNDARQITQSTQWQMRSPSLYKGKITYQSGADLFVYDLAANTRAPLSVYLTTDRDQQRLRWLEKPLDYLSGASAAPSGKSVTITARGQFVTGFTGERRRVNYTLPSGARARSAVMGESGEWVYALIDRNLSGEIWKFAADGSGEGKVIKSGIDAHIWFISAAPKGEVLIYSDKRGKLYRFDAESGETILMDTAVSSSDFNFGDLSWSKDGRYLAYGFYDARDIAQIAVYDTEANTKSVMTRGKFESFAPAFSEDNGWLYFLSNRNFDATPGSPWGDRNMGPAFAERAKVYALQLDPEAAFPFTAENELTAESGDDVKDKEDSEGDDAKDGDKDKTADEDKRAALDLSGAAARLWPVPVSAGDFTGLAATKDNLFILEGGGSDLVYTSRNKRTLKRLSIGSDDPELETYAGDVAGFSLSADHKTLFVQTGSRSRAKFMLLKAGSDFPKDASDKTVRLSDWRLAIDPSNEWRQMALDAWRLHRDFAYDTELRGVNWNAVRDKFVPFASRLGHRSELNDLLAQMSAELGILHSQIRPGELPEDEESGNPAFLGAVYEAVSGGLKITSIRNGEADRPETLGPLMAPGVDVLLGDIITAVDGRPIATKADLALALSQKSGQQVRLELMRKKASHSEIVIPVSRRGESMLQYTDWVQKSRDTVAKTSQGEIGYLHLRAMGSGDVESFARDYYEHFDKDGLIIDVRGNNGGNIDSWIIGTLLRKAWAFWPGANGGQSYTNMQQTFRGHLVVLINEGTYSDGETFAAGIKALNIAPTIGTRTAGAGIWLSGRNRLVDGGQARIAEYGQHGLDGRWLIEGYGVGPDMEVTNPPHSTYNGEDRQLATSLSYLKEKIAAEPIKPLRVLSYPRLGEHGQDVD